MFFMLLIPLLLLILFQYIPLYGIQIAFRDYKPMENIGTARWVGMKHFIRFFQYKGFKMLLKNTLVLNIYSLLLTPLPLLFALCINYLPFVRLKQMIQTVSVMPHFLSVVVVCQITMQFLSVDGSLNVLRMLLGRNPVNFLIQGELFSSIYVCSGAWQSLGYSAIVYISALADTSREQREAAALDGASLFQRIMYIDLPGILPLFGVNVIFQCGALLNNNYEKILLLQNNMNLPYSQVISTYTYDIAFNGVVPQYSMAMAVGLTVSVMNLAMLLIMKHVVRGWEDMNV